MRQRRYATIVFLSCFLCLACAAAQEKSPFEQLVAAEAMNDDLDSIQSVWRWEQQIEYPDGQLGTIFEDRTKAVFANRLETASEKVITESVSMPGEKPEGNVIAKTTIYYKDSYYHFDRWTHQERQQYKFADEPEPYDSDFPPEGFTFMTFEERFIATQSREGDTLLFTINPEAVNAYFKEIGTPRKLVKGTVEVELASDGSVRKTTGTGTYVEGAGTETTLHYKGVIEIEQRGGVTIAFPPELDAYQEIERPGSDFPEDDEEDE
jgi:hypothetical protein